MNQEGFVEFLKLFGVLSDEACADVCVFTVKQLQVLFRTMILTQGSALYTLVLFLHSEFQISTEEREAICPANYHMTFTLIHYYTCLQGI